MYILTRICVFMYMHVCVCVSSYISIWYMTFENALQQRIQHQILKCALYSAFI